MAIKELKSHRCNYKNANIQQFHMFPLQTAAAKQQSLRQAWVARNQMTVWFTEKLAIHFSREVANSFIHSFSAWSRGRLIHLSHSVSKEGSFVHLTNNNSSNSVCSILIHRRRWGSRKGPCAWGGSSRGRAGRHLRRARPCMQGRSCCTSPAAATAAAPDRIEQKNKSGVRSDLMWCERGEESGKGGAHRCNWAAGEAKEGIRAGEPSRRRGSAPTSRREARPKYVQLVILILCSNYWFWCCIALSYVAM